MAFVIDLDHTAPEVISLAKARKQLQLESDFIEDDSLITDYIDAAIVQAENYINSEINEKKFEVRGKSFHDVLGFRKQKITSIESIVYKNEAGESITIAATNYSLQNVDKYENEIVFNDDYVLPIVKEYSSAAVVLKVTVGYPSGKVPKIIQKVLLVMVSESYENRTDTVKEKSTATENALHPYKRF